MAHVSSTNPADTDPQNIEVRPPRPISPSPSNYIYNTTRGRGSRGRGGGRGRGRGGASNRGGQVQVHQTESRSDSTSYNHPRPHTHVPNLNQLHPSTPVSIILKADQATGRQVQGFVADILTNGNHPRGIKVRLQDGRVGRVQRIVSEQEARNAYKPATGEMSSSTIEEAEYSSASTRQPTMTSSSGAGMKYSDHRTDDNQAGLEDRTANISLADYVVVKKKGKNKKGKQADENDNAVAFESDQQNTNKATDFLSNGKNEEDAILTCFFCSFRGDEPALSHHIKEHLDWRNWQNELSEKVMNVSDRAIPFSGTRVSSRILFS